MRVKIKNTALHNGKIGFLVPASDDPDDFWDHNVIFEDGSRIGVTRDQIEIEPIEIFVVMNVEADSWSGRSTPSSYHLTLEGAEAAIPERFKTASFDRTASYGEKYGHVKNYTYFTIDIKTVLA